MHVMNSEVSHFVMPGESVLVADADCILVMPKSTKVVKIAK